MSERSIYFPLAWTKTLDIRPGNSHFSSIPAVFAVHSTSFFENDRPVYRTDQRGLDKLAQAARSASEEINDTLLALSKIAAYSKPDELHEWEYATFMWTINRLCELRSDLDMAANDMEYAARNGHCLRVNLDSYQGAAESEGGTHD